MDSMFARNGKNKYSVRAGKLKKNLAEKKLTEFHDHLPAKRNPNVQFETQVKANVHLLKGVHLYLL